MVPPDGKAKLTVSAFYNVLNKTPNVYYTELQVQNISYQIQKENWCIVSGTNVTDFAL